MIDDRQQPQGGQQSLSQEEQLLQQAFGQEPEVEQLSPGQMVRRALFPRWEIITPAAYDPRVEENRMLQDLFDLNDIEPPASDERPLH